MQSNKLKSFTFAGFLLLIGLFLIINLLANTFLRGAKVDLTQNKLHTLTQGTRNIVNKIDEPISLYLFFSDKTSEGIPFIRTYATRVQELLEEYVQTSKGKINLQVIDPLPYSEEEDRASQFGLPAIPTGNAGDSIYFGLAGSNSVGDVQTIPFFQPGKEAFLEYDVSKLVYTLANPKRPVVGVLSRLSLFGGFDLENQRMGNAWAVISQLQQLFEVRTLDPALKKVDDDIDVLLIAHPKDLSLPTLYAIDQFVLKGGKAMIFVDPYSEASTPLRDPNSNSPLEGEGARASDLELLFNTWGISFDPSSVVIDRKYALVIGGAHQEQVHHYALLGVREESINSSDVITAGLNSISFAMPGYLKPKEGATTTLTPLVTSSKEAMLHDSAKFNFMPDASVLADNYKPASEQYIFAARVSGKVKTAFPTGMPKSEKVEDKKESETNDKQLMESAKDINLIVVADTDIISDQMWVQAQDFFGQQVINAWANNGDFTANAIDNLFGSSDLISIRGRATSTRPFERVAELQRTADQNFRAKEQTLQAKLRETEQKLTALQAKRNDNTSMLLTPEQQAEIEQFQNEKLKVRKELRQVRHNLDKDIEQLGTALKAINIGAIPVLISLLVLFISVARIRKRKHS